MSLVLFYPIEGEFFLAVVARGWGCGGRFGQEQM